MTIDLPKIGKPATNALHHIGVKTLEDIAGYDRTTLLAIHGVGPKAMDILEDNLKKHNMNFKEDIGFDVPFHLTGFDAFYQELEDHKETIVSIDVKMNISHGKSGALHGTQILENGTTIYFADMFEFTSRRKDAKVKSITSYIIMNEGES